MGQYISNVWTTCTPTSVAYATEQAMLSSVLVALTVSSVFLSPYCLKIIQACFSVRFQPDYSAVIVCIMSSIAITFDLSQFFISNSTLEQWLQLFIMMLPSKAFSKSMLITGRNLWITYSY